MRRSAYKDLMESLDAGINNGHGDEILAMTPEELVADLVDEGALGLGAIGDKEIETAVAGWQRRTRDYIKEILNPNAWQKVEE